MTHEELLVKIDEHACFANCSGIPQKALYAILDWAVEKANIEFEVYDDISYGEVIAAQEVYEILKKELS